MDRVGWTRERNNCESWSSLDPDLLVIVAKHCDATSVCRLSQACKSWRDAVARQAEEIWEPLVRTRFPRMVSLVKAMPPRPGFSFAGHYQAQLNAERMVAGARTETACQLSDFYFSVELVTAGETRRVVEEWTGILGQKQSPGFFTCPLDCREFRNTWTEDGILIDDTNPLMLEVFVSRAVFGDIKTRKLYSSGTEPDGMLDDEEFVFNSKPLPATLATTRDHEYAPVAQMQVFLDTPFREVILQFETYYPHHDFVEMETSEVLEYLDRGIDWF